MTGARPHDSPYDSATGSPDGSAEDSPDLGALLADIEDAERTLRGIARTTPMEASRWLADRVGGPVHLKCENLQRAGSFKIRGAYVRISRLSQAERARGVVAASAGNHAQGVALAARLLDTRATVFMPFGAPIPKEEATRSYGADVRFHGHTIDEALVAARQYSEETGAVFIHPFDHADIMAGQGTLGLEILEQCPDVATVLVSTGGGGLVAGVAAALAGRGSKARVVGVQAAGAAAYPPSLAAGRPVPVERMRTMADGSRSAARAGCRSRSSGAGSPAWSPCRRSRCRGRCCCSSNAASCWSSPRGRRPSRLRWTPRARSSRRWSRSCPGATSIRCC